MTTCQILYRVTSKRIGLFLIQHAQWQPQTIALLLSTDNCTIENVHKISLHKEKEKCTILNQHKTKVSMGV